LMIEVTGEVMSNFSNKTREREREKREESGDCYSSWETGKEIGRSSSLPFITFCFDVHDGGLFLFIHLFCRWIIPLADQNERIAGTAAAVCYGHEGYGNLFFAC
jgi:hypothetical protein